jgi:hypothetical protein
MQIELLLSTVQEPWDPLQQVLEKVCGLTMTRL